MVGSINPLVKRGNGVGPLWAVWTFAVGALASSTVLGLAMTTVGHIIHPRVSPGSLLLLGASWAILGAADLRLFGMSTPSLLRQTSSHWVLTLGIIRGWFTWGIDLGLGFSTLRVTSGFWALACVAILMPSPWSVLSISLYGVGVTTGVLAATVWLHYSELLDVIVRRLLAYQGKLRIAFGTILSAAGVAMVGNAVVR
jgi:hypothetical protein